MFRMYKFNLMKTFYTLVMILSYGFGSNVYCMDDGQQKTFKQAIVFYQNFIPGMDIYPNVFIEVGCMKYIQDNGIAKFLEKFTNDQNLSKCPMQKKYADVIKSIDVWCQKLAAVYVDNRVFKKHLSENRENRLKIIKDFFEYYSHMTGVLLLDKYQADFRNIQFFDESSMQVECESLSLLKVILGLHETAQLSKVFDRKTIGDVKFCQKRDEIKNQSLSDCCFFGQHTLDIIREGQIFNLSGKESLIAGHIRKCTIEIMVKRCNLTVQKVREMHNRFNDSAIIEWHKRFNIIYAFCRHIITDELATIPDLAKSKYEEFLCKSLGLCIQHGLFDDINVENIDLKNKNLHVEVFFQALQQHIIEIGQCLFVENVGLCEQMFLEHKRCMDSLFTQEAQKIQDRTQLCCDWRDIGTVLQEQEKKEFNCFVAYNTLISRKQKTVNDHYKTKRVLLADSLCRSQELASDALFVEKKTIFDQAELSVKKQIENNCKKFAYLLEKNSKLVLQDYFNRYRRWSGIQQAALKQLQDKQKMFDNENAQLVLKADELSGQKQEMYDQVSSPIQQKVEKYNQQYQKCNTLHQQAAQSLLASYFNRYVQWGHHQAVLRAENKRIIKQHNQQQAMDVLAQRLEQKKIFKDWLTWVLLQTHRPKQYTQSVMCQVRAHDVGFGVDAAAQVVSQSSVQAVQTEIVNGRDVGTDSLEQDWSNDRWQAAGYTNVRRHNFYLTT